MRLPASTRSTAGKTRRFTVLARCPRGSPRRHGMGGRASAVPPDTVACGQAGLGAHDAQRLAGAVPHRLLERGLTVPPLAIAA